MGLPQDLKDYKADSFVILTEGEIAVIAAVLGFGLLAYDILSRIFS